jgi:hypothetical protein
MGRENGGRRVITAAAATIADIVRCAWATTTTCARSRWGEGAGTMKAARYRPHDGISDVAREVHAAARRRRGFLDAPVSGNGAGAENGKLTSWSAVRRMHLQSPSLS